MNSKNSVELSLKEIKVIELGILSFFDSFCRNNNIEYSLCGGTLLGAIRHQGFIPWDDDIDVFMTRKNYETFINSFFKEANNRFQLITFATNNKYNYLFSKLVDSRTRLVENHNFEVDGMGVFIDIFPIDYLGETKEDAIRFLNKFKFDKYVGIASNWRHFYLNKSKGFVRQFPRFLFYLMSRGKNIKKKYCSIELELCTKKPTKMMGCIFGSYGEREIMEKEVFKDIKYVLFENNYFPIIAQYDKYLSSLYGNYMELPPLDKQVTHHTFKAFWR